MDEIKLSLGMELEWSDIDRRVCIPEELGSWEGPKIGDYYMGSEIDIVNTKGEWRGITADPLCITCPVGGEIHTTPSYTVDTQLLRTMEIMGLFSTIGVGPTSHSHIHVGIPGIRTRLDLIKNLFAYVRKNELDILKYCYGWNSAMQELVWNSKVNCESKLYLHWDGGKMIFPKVYDIVEKCQSVEAVFNALEEFKVLEYDWITGESGVRPDSRRTAVNLYNLTKGETVEFRCFRGSLNPVELYSVLTFCKMCIAEALKGTEGKSVRNLLSEHNFTFPHLDFKEDLMLGWENSKHQKGRGGPFKKYSGYLPPTEDILLSRLEKISYLDSEDERSYLSILNLCKEDFQKRSTLSLESNLEC